MSGRKKKSGVSARKGQQLLRRMVEADADLQTLADMAGVSLMDLAQWAGEADAQRQLEGLRKLADMQAQMIVSRYRVTAAARLVHLANQEADPELARKACVELLKADLLNRQQARVKRGAGQTDAATSETNRQLDEVAQQVDEKNLLVALEQMGSHFTENDQ